LTLTERNFAAGLFEKFYPEGLNKAKELLLKEGFLFLLGTEEKVINRIFRDAVIRQVCSGNSWNIVPQFAGDLHIFKTLDSSIVENDHEPIRKLLLIKDADSFFGNQEEATHQDFYEVLTKHESGKVFLLILMDKSIPKGVKATIAPLLNRSSIFVLETDILGRMYLLDQYAKSKKLLVSAACRDRMKTELAEFQVPVDLMLESIRQLSNFRKATSSPDAEVQPDQFEETGGFRKVLEILGDKFIQHWIKEARKHHEWQVSDTERVPGRIFRAFLRKEGESLSFVGMDCDSIAKRSGLELSIVETFLQLGRQDPFNFFIKKEGKEYFRFEELEEYWDDWKTWKEEEWQSGHTYHTLRLMALAYHSGQSGLLSGSQLDLALKWEKETKPTLAWAISYAPEFELTQVFIEKSAKQRESDIEAMQRRTKRLLQMTRAIAFVVGLAFLLSTGGAVLAGLERNNALEAKDMADKQRQTALRAKKAADTARDIADLEKKKAIAANASERIARIQARLEATNAVIARDAANFEKNRALTARNAEREAKQDAEREKQVAIQAKALADNLRVEAENAKDRADQSYIEANENYKKAEMLRRQQESRAEAFSAQNLYLSSEWENGLRKAEKAYQIHLANQGNPYDPDHLKALLSGLVTPGSSFLTQGKQPLHQIAADPLGKYYAVCTVTGLIDIISLRENLRVTTIKIPLQKFQTFTFSPAGHLLVGTKDGLLQVYEAKTGRLYFSLKIADVPILSIYSLYDAFTNQTGNSENYRYRTDRYILSAGNQLFLLNGLYAETEISNMALPLGDAIRRVVIDKNSSKIYITQGKNLLFLPFQEGKFMKEVIPFKTLNNALTSLNLGLLEKQIYLYVGDRNGYLYLIRANDGEILLQKKNHQSSVTQCHIGYDHGNLVLISSGFDHRIHTDYVSLSANGELKPLSSVNFDFHKGWVTDMVSVKNQQFFMSCSDDMTIRKWQFNPTDIQASVKFTLDNYSK